MRSCDANSVSLAASLEGEFEQMPTEEEVGADASAEPAHFSCELSILLDRATQLLGITWPAEPEQQGSLMDGSFYEQRPGFWANHCSPRGGGACTVMQCHPMMDA